MKMRHVSENWEGWEVWGSTYFLREGMCILCHLQDCGLHINPAYQQSLSNTGTNISCAYPSCRKPCDPILGQCGFEVTYGDATGMRGAWGRDRVTIGPFTTMAPFGTHELYQEMFPHSQRHTTPGCLIKGVVGDGYGNAAEKV
jgi:hypothetical protein